ncbi:MAG: ATP-binding protein [Candidatus Cryptobacteroides sp.]
MNPFVTTGYAGPDYFCDREKETEYITGLLENGNNIALISPRRYGKTDLIRHCFDQENIRERYYTFIIDIYSTNSFAELTERLAKSILEELKPRGEKAWSAFINTLSSIKAGISYDAAGVPSFSLSVGDIHNPSNTLDEIFAYINNSDKRCLIAIDEFQQITKYSDKNVEARLRTYIQYCSNANFIFCGSQREMMGAMFTSSSRPFYQSSTIMNLPPIAKDKYLEFCQRHFCNSGKSLDSKIIDVLYDKFDSTTFYLQKVMNILFMRTEYGTECRTEDIDDAINYIIDFSSETYEDLLYQIPEKQKLLLIAIASEGKVSGLTSGKFIKKYALQSASSASSAAKGLMDKGLITFDRGKYMLYDHFFRIWIVSRHLSF